MRGATEATPVVASVQALDRPPDRRFDPRSVPRDVAGQLFEPAFQRE